MPDTPTMDSVYFYKFNNYYNRIIKRYENIEDYGDPIASQLNCNFVHGDGVNASFTLNKGLNLNDTPDYCVVSDYNGNISRWYVINSFKSRSGQDLLTLRRDLIADFYDDVVSYSPCLIRKGYVPQTNPFIFNDEGVKYNKQKESEILIKDNSECSYIIGFISNNASAQATVNGTVKSTDYDYYYPTLADFTYKNYVEGAGNNHTESKRQINNNSPQTRIYYSVTFSGKSKKGENLNDYKRNYELIFRSTGIGKPSYYTSIYGTSVYNGFYYNTNAYSNSVRLISSFPYGGSNNEINYLQNNFPNALFSNLNFSSLQNAGLKALEISDSLSDLSQFNGKKVKIGNVIYKVSLGYENTTNRVVTYNNDPYSQNGQAFQSITTHFNNNRPTYSQLSSGNYDLYYDGSYYTFYRGDFKVMATTQDVYLIFTESQEDIHTAVDGPNARTHLIEQPYDMFMLINEDGVNYKVGTTPYVSNHDVNINIAQAICQSYGSASYDIQIVPFNPIQGTILADGTLNFYGFDTHEIYNSSNQVIGHYVMCPSADLKLLLDKDELKFNPENYKLDYNTKQYRLCSPNQETVFDFSPAMNMGIDTWQVTANYRPYSSYIKIQPTWNWLYGVNQYNGLTDFRGLVYNSTLCITQLNDNYANYVANNKNFQQLFDNQINTLTKQNAVQINAMEETLGWRSYTGMPLSSVARVIGGYKDIEMQKELNNIALSKMQTDFNYQMDNIQSMPHTIKKLTQINGDTRIFPYIEVYSATEDEIRSFNNKIKYTGMTIMTTGKINDFLQVGEETFIQASLIRLDTSRSEESANNQIAIEIANELDKGVYITKESE